MADELLRRLELDAAAIRKRAAQKQTHELLAELQLAYLLNVPFDTTMLHFHDEDFVFGPSEKPIPMGKGKGVKFGLMEAFHNIVQQRRGGYCFTSNGLFASLLRELGYKVSELAARVNTSRNTDSKTQGCKWALYSHMVLFVEADGQRWLVDVGFGGGSSHFPLLVEDGAQVKSLSPSESFELRHEPLQDAHPDTFRDAATGWTLYRHFADTPSRPAYASACYHILPVSLAPVDWEMLNFFNSNSPTAGFINRCLVSQLLPDGNRKTFQYIAGDAKGKYTLRDGQIGQIVEEEDVEPTVGGVVDLLRRRFGLPIRPRTIARIQSA